MATTITDLWDEFQQATGQEGSTRTLAELHRLWRVADLRYDRETPEAFWILVFGRDDDADCWADGGIDWPTAEQWAAFEQWAASEQALEQERTS